MKIGGMCDFLWKMKLTHFKICRTEHEFNIPCKLLSSFSIKKVISLNSEIFNIASVRDPFHFWILACND